jgi:hypothetical protein
VCSALSLFSRLRVVTDLNSYLHELKLNEAIRVLQSYTPRVAGGSVSGAASNVKLSVM